MLTRLRPELVLVPAFRGLLNRTYSARNTTSTTSLILFTFTRANLRGTAFKINQLHLATIATLANISVDKLTRFCRGVNSVDTCIVCRSGSLALVIFGEPRWSGTTCESARSNRVKASIETNPGSSTCNVCTCTWTCTVRSHLQAQRNLSMQMLNLTVQKRDGIPALLVRYIYHRSSLKSIGTHAAAATDRSLHWFYVIFLAHCNAFVRSKSTFHGHGSSFPVFSGLRSTSPNAKTARKISTLP